MKSLLTWTVLGLSCPLGIGGPTLASAADPKPKKPAAVTTVEDADADFAIQGEYAGCAVWNGCWQQVGLQVVALGDGKFQGMIYPGGLPGNGYNGGSKAIVQGQREGELVVLTGESARIVLQTGRAVTVQSPGGGHAGYLQPLQRYSPTVGALPPANAKILFDGTDNGTLKGAKISEAGLLQIGAETVDPVQDFILHGEFKTPYMPTARSQARGNSGFYLQRRYEVQVLDSFGLEPAFNESASLYRFKAPDLNMSFPPLSWQTYDIHFTAARFNEAGEKTSKARITVWHNGVVVQNNVELENKTGGGRPESAELLPILFQNHGDPVEYRNLWIVDTTPQSGSGVGTSVLAASCQSPAVTCASHSSRKVRTGWFRRCR